MTQPSGPNLCLVAWCILMPTTSPTAKPISIFIIMDVRILSSMLTLLIWLLSSISTMVPSLTTALQNETSLESRWVARSRTTSRTSRRCSTKTSRTPVSQVRLQKSLSLYFPFPLSLTCIYLVGNPVTSNLSELCISPSKMRFKFPPHFYWVSIAPSPKAPSNPPPHTLYLASASEFWAQPPSLRQQLLFSSSHIWSKCHGWRRILAALFLYRTWWFDSLPPWGQPLFCCTWQPSFKLPAHRDDLGHICKKFFYHAALFGTCQPIRIILTIGKKCHIEPSSLQEDGPSGWSTSFIMIITIIMMMTKIMLILIRIPGGTLHLIRPPAPGYTPFIHDTTLPLSSAPHIGRIVWIFPPRVNSRPAKLWHNAANETFPDWQCLLSPF